MIITVDHLKGIAGKATKLMPGLVEHINLICPEYGIDEPHEFAHFLAQACHETAYFRTLQEYASGEAYEGRMDLGNTEKGDGVRFKGRGIFQTTGRANYTQLGIAYKIPNLFIDTPTLLEQPKYAVWSACEYWKTRNINDIANMPDTYILKCKRKGTVHEVPPVDYISMVINGGFNGIEDRRKLYWKAKCVLGVA